MFIINIAHSICAAAAPSRLVANVVEHKEKSRREKRSKPQRGSECEEG